MIFLRVISGLFIAALAFGQVNGTVEGVVADASGATVTGAAVTVTEESTGMVRATVTDGTGRFAVLSLPPGIVRVEVKHLGFRSEARTGVGVSAGRSTRVDITLKVGEVSERVEVVAETPLLSTSASNWGGGVTKAQLDQLPLKGRDMFDLAVQQPGAQLATSSARGTTNGLGIPVAVEGARPNMNSFRLDGLSMNDSTGSAPASASGRLLGLETIAELSFISSPFSAEYGRSGGAVINAVSASGGNLLHGKLYEFWRNSALDAKNFFDSATERIPPLRKNHFGGMLNGPVLKNKVFYLVNVEALRENYARTSRVATLSDDARRGVLPTRVTIPISVVTRPYLDLYPVANGRVLGGGAAEYISAAATNTRETFVAGKLDYAMNDRWRMAGRYTFDTGEQTLPDYFDSFLLTGKSGYQFAQGNAQRIVSPNTIEEFRFGFSRVFNEEASQPITDAAAKLGFLKGKAVGTMRVPGLEDVGGSRELGVRTRPRRYDLDDWQASYQLSQNRGRHAFKVGGSFDHQQFHQRADIAGAGLYEFGSLEDFLRGRASNADFMTPGSDSDRNWRIHLFSFFAQDEMRLDRRLTLTLGVRYDAHSTPQERDGKVATLRDPLRDTAVTVGGDIFRNPSLKNFAPRASLAWDTFGNGRTVIRAGFGMFYDLLGTRDIIIGGVRMPPFFRRTVTRNPSFPDMLAASVGSAPTDSPDVLAYDQNQPYLLKFRFALENRIGAGTLVRITYSGSRGAHLSGILTEFNTRVPRVMPDGRLFFAATAPSRNPAFLRFKLRLSEFNSFYHGFLSELQHRWKSGLRMQAGYTFSKSIDDNSTVINRDFLGGETMANPFNLRGNQGLSDFDIRHSFTLNGSYSIPAPRAGKWLLGGWELHGLLLARTGPAFSTSVGFDRANIVGGAADYGQRPDRVVGVPLVQGGPNQYFNPLAFSLPEAGYFGNSGRNVISGPGLVSLDTAIQKTIWKTERSMLRLRGEAFNIANRPNFQIPTGVTLFNARGERLATAGRISSTTTASRQMQIAARWEF